MATILGFDVETNGLLPELTRIHCLAIKDLITGKIDSYTDDCDPNSELGIALNITGGIEEGLARLSEADMIVGHNITKFDIPAIKKVYPSWTYRGLVLDTMVMSRVIWPHLKDVDFRKAKRGNYPLPGFLYGSHSLKAWGLRMGEHKGDYSGGWDLWNPEMHRYMVQDIVVTERLYTLVISKNLSDVCRDLEHDVAEIVARQERRGFCFDYEGGKALSDRLTIRSLELEEELRAMFLPWPVNHGVVTPTKKLSRWQTLVDGTAEFVAKKEAQALIAQGQHCWPHDQMADVPFTKIEWKVFNPGSRDHFSDRLIKLFGWEPEEFGRDGKPKLDSDTLEGIELPGAEPVKEFLMIDKRIGQIAKGRQAWLKVFNGETGCIHGSVNTNGAVTGRMTHASPNAGQVPSVRKPYGKECRTLWRARPGYKLVGADASALELCDLAGYMAKYDHGAYIKEVLYGLTDEAKAKGEDMHSNNARALGLDPKTKYQVGGDLLSGRDIAKTWFYAFIYGSGDENLGRILGKPKGAPAKKAGKASRASFLTNLPALGHLVRGISKALKANGKLRGLDGRPLYVRSHHAALNTLLQSAGAVIMKKALVILDKDILQGEYGLTPGVDYEFVANVHDEWQIEALPVLADQIGKAACEAMKRAGEFFEFPCPISGSYEVGDTWADTH